MNVFLRIVGYFTLKVLAKKQMFTSPFHPFMTKAMKNPKTISGRFSNRWKKKISQSSEPRQIKKTCMAICTGYILSSQ